MKLEHVDAELLVDYKVESKNNEQFRYIEKSNNKSGCRIGDLLDEQMKKKLKEIR